MSDVDMNSITIEEYKRDMYEAIKLVQPWVTYDELEPALNYSINKRYQEAKCNIVNTYTNKNIDMTLLGTTDYIKRKNPIVTAYGTLFSNNESEVVNLLRHVVDSFLTNRSIHKKEMFKHPKGSELFNYYNQMQSLTI